MSGGSYDYKYYVIEDYYENKMFDIELNDMMSDLIKLLHDLEWWRSDDISEEAYRETVDNFKKKWFKRDKIKIKELIEKEFEDKKQELLKTFKYMEE